MIASLKYYFLFHWATRLQNRSMKLIDIGVNLTDDMYNGYYNGKRKHDADIENILKRAWQHNIDKIIITGTNLSDSAEAIKICQKNDRLFSTVGCHPTKCNEFENASSTPDEYFASLLQLTEANRERVVAIGECGLDYFRTNFCPIDIQKRYFSKQIELAEATGLPMFLHCRDSVSDLISILAPRRDSIRGAVVHSFDGTSEELKRILELDLYVGVNGCSLKTEENLRVAAEILSDRLLIETDAPWCEIRPSHASAKHVQTKLDSKKNDKWEPDKLVKGRNEPCNLRQVLEVLSAIKSEDIESLAERIYENTLQFFSLKS